MRTIHLAVVLAPVVLLAAVVLVLAAVPRATTTETCFYRSERISGLNKLCYYDCPSGAATFTIKSTRLCPITWKRER